MSKSEIDAYQRTSNYCRRPRIISTNTFKILFYLAQREGFAYFSEIKMYLNRSSSQVSQIMKRLKFKNYVKANNCRPLKYTITEVGRKINRQTIKDFLKYRDKKNNGRNKMSTKTSLISHNNIVINDDWLEFAELEEYYKDILISFFIELPEILVDLNINFTPEKYHIFVEETKNILLKYNIRLS